MMNRDSILDTLRQGVATVTFTKVNGDERVMDCTLRSDLIPEAMLPKTDGNLSLTEGVDRTVNVVRAYDIKAEGWRSFRVENVKNIASN